MNSRKRLDMLHLRLQEHQDALERCLIRISLHGSDINIPVYEINTRKQLEEAINQIKIEIADLDNIDQPLRYIEDRKEGERLFGLAKADYQKALVLEQQEEVNSNRVELYLNRSEVRLRDAIQKGYVSAEAFLIRGNIYEKRRLDFIEAYGCYTTAVNLDDEYIEAYRARYLLCNIHRVKRSPYKQFANKSCLYDKGILREFGVIV